MPFDNSGNYTPPAGATSAAPGQVIASATWNSIHSDLATALTTLGQCNAINNVNTTQGATIANTSETDLITIALPANLLDVNGNGIRLTAFGTCPATATTKRMRLYFGATVVSDTTAVTINNGAWKLDAIIIRTGATAQIAQGTEFSTQAAGPSTVVSSSTQFGTPAETLANAITVKITGQNGTANANDIVARGLMYEPVNMA